ncbi:hypothetical protein FISHEDRAFT_76392 [Fistulina hepatica ATCC 64428]|uniref:Sc15 protein n=1 Tax=Fistulina hepatica ATCC 64428 TaxID=1128425 RepID=A0A0D7A475_9AGAR|nr:hypothetical protein FISHEDRAFT_76392 [Fistulina hepatica ATCC 64428]
MFASLSKFVAVGLVALVGVAAALPNSGVVKRTSSADDVISILETLRSSTDEILPQISGLVANGTASDDTVTPLTSSLVSAMNNAASSVKDLASVDSVTDAEQSQIGDLLKTIVDDVLTTIDSLNTTAAVTTLATIKADVYSSMGLVTGLLGTVLGLVLGLVGLVLALLVAILSAL